MPHALLDASALVALFDINDRHHTTCKDHLRTAQKQGRHLITTWPCVTEASYILSPLSHIVMLRWLSAAVTVDNLSVADLPAMPVGQPPVPAAAVRQERRWREREPGGTE